MNLKTAVLLVSLTASVGAWAISSRQLAVEQEALFKRLAPTDQMRPVMALRLADLLFDASTEVEKGKDFTAKQAKEMEVLRLRAIDLYENSLSGFSGTFKSPKGTDALRIQFQLARLYMDQGYAEKADRLWESLAAQTIEPRIRKESALRRAEKLEMSSNPDELQKAKNYYDIAFSTCGTKDLCSYILYRRGWVSHRLGASDLGLQDLLKSLESTEAGSVADIIKDVILFLSHSTKTPEKSVTLIEGIGQKYQKTDLVEQLSLSFYTADRRDHYRYAVEYLNKKSPRIDRLVSLLEQDYSEKNTKSLREHFAAIKKLSPEAFNSPAKKTEAQKVLYRLIVQFDGELSRNPEYKEFFNAGVEFYTRVYSNGPEIDKVIDGWLAVETDQNLKLARLQEWIVQYKAVPARALRLHKARLGVAVKAKDNTIVAEESAYLAQVTTASEEKRNFLYQQGRAYYEQKNYAQALPIFVGLAQVGNKKPDSNAIFSQNLTLDILAQEKRFDEARAQARSWTESKSIQKFAAADASLQKELADMNAISEKALFEKSSKSGDIESLKNFKQFCLTDKFTPKSCENAKTLAIQLKDQDSLIAILRKTGKKEELTSELEFGGYFLEAAQLLEPGLANAGATFEDHLKVAMLFEIGGDYKNRDRLLISTGQFAAKTKKPLSEPQWEIYYLSLKDAGLVNAKTLALPWTQHWKLRLASELETAGQGNAETQALLKGTCQDYGTPWQKLQLANLKTLNEKQKAIHFIGKGSQKNFERRIAALKELSKSTECFLKGASLEQRYGVFHAMVIAYQDLGHEIRSTPIPDGVEGEILEQVKAQIEEMAQPFDKTAAEWRSQAAATLAKLPDVQRAPAEANYASWEFDAPEVKGTKLQPPTFNWQPLLTKLKQNPFDNQTLADLKNHFQNRGLTRLAAYFEGRMKKE